MGLTLKQLAKATELAEELTKVDRDLSVLTKLWGAAKITVCLEPDASDHNRREVGGPMMAELTIWAYKDILRSKRDLLKSELEDLGVSIEVVR